MMNDIVTGKLNRGRKCSICMHPDLAAIDLAIVQGMEPKAISTQFNIGKQVVLRHRAKHVPTRDMAAGAIAVAEEQALTGGDLLRRASRLLEAAESILGEARGSGDRIGALRAIREAARTIELCAKLTGDIDSATTVNVLVSPALQALQHVILCALAHFPVARQAVVVALSHMAGDGDGPLLIGHAEAS